MLLVLGFVAVSCSGTIMPSKHRQKLFIFLKMVHSIHLCARGCHPPLFMYFQNMCKNTVRNTGTGTLQSKTWAQKTAKKPEQVQIHAVNKIRGWQVVQIVQNNSNLIFEVQYTKITGFWKENIQESAQYICCAVLWEKGKSTSTG